MAKKVAFFLALILMPYKIFANIICFPQVAMGGGYSTTITLMNTGTSSISSQIHFFNQSGGTLAASAPVNIPVDGTARVTLPDSGTLTVGWAMVDAGIGSIQGVAVFEARSNGGLDTVAGVLAIESSNQFALPIDLTSTADTGVAIANIGSFPVSVTARLIEENGTQVAVSAETRLNPLGAKSQLAVFVSQLFPQYAGKSFKGSLIVDAASGAPNNSIAATSLVFKEGMYSAVPVIPSRVPSFQSDSIRATVTQFAVNNDNSNAILVYTIENTTDDILYLAHIHYSEALEDNKTTRWATASSVFGIADVNSGYNNAKSSDFTAIAPSERITVIWRYGRSSGENIPGSVFSFTDQLYFFDKVTSAVKRVTLGFPLITVGLQSIPIRLISNPPVFESDLILATVAQLNVSSDNSNVMFSYTIQNKTNSTLYLAHIHYSEDMEDNKVTRWAATSSVSGIADVNSGYNSGKSSDFTAIAPSARITVIWHYGRSSGGTTPGTLFSFSDQMYFYTPAGVNMVSLGFSAMQPTQ